MAARTAFGLTLAALVVAVAACTSSSGGGTAADGGIDAATDASVDAPTDAPADTSAECCPRSPQTSGCMDLGGVRPDVGCLQTCDFWCSTNWRVEKDAYGCEVWRYDVVYPDGGGSCFADAGSDAPLD